MKKVILFTVFTMTIMAPRFINACSCDSLYPFLYNLTDRTIVFEGRILSHHQLPIEEIRSYNKLLMAKEWGIKTDDEKFKTLPPPPFNFTSYTVIKVEKVLKGMYVQDTVIFFNGHDSMCLSSLENKEIGSLFIFKMGKTNGDYLDKNVKAYLLNKGLIQELINKPIFINSICEEWYLVHRDEFIVGYITANYHFIFAREFVRLHPNMNETERIQYREGLAKIKLERMTYEEIIAVINKM